MLSIQGNRIFIEGDLTLDSVPDVDRALQALPLRAGFIVNCTHVKEVDSSAVALFVAWRRNLGEAFVIEALPPALLALAELYQVIDWFSFSKDEGVVLR